MMWASIEIVLVVKRSGPQRVQTGDVPQLIARDVSNAWPLDFHDIGAEPRQHLATCWSSLNAGEVDNFDSFEWQFRTRVGHGNSPVECGYFSKRQAPESGRNRL